MLKQNFQRVATKQELMHFQSSYKTLLALSGSYSKKIPHTFLQLTSNTTDILRESLVQNTTHCFRVSIKEYWHFKRVPSKLNYSRNFFLEFISQNTNTLRKLYHTILIYTELKYQTVLTLWQSYYQTIVNTFSRVSMKTWTVRIYSNWKFPSKSEKVSINTWNRYFCLQLFLSLNDSSLMGLWK